MSVSATLKTLCAEQLRAGVFTHVYCSCGFFGAGQEVYSFSHLPHDLDVFDLASLTKPLVTLPLLVHDFLQNRFDFTCSLDTWLDTGGHGLDKRLVELSLASLLCHRSGLPAWRNFWINSLGEKFLAQTEVIEILNRTAPQIKKDECSVYSDINFILLGLGLEIKKGQRLDLLFNSFLQDYLQIKPQSYLGFCPEDKEKAIPTGYCRVRKRPLQGEVHDENCAVCGGISGHAGLFSSGPDLVTFLCRLYVSQVGDEIIHRNREMLDTSDALHLFGLWRGDNYTGRWTVGHPGFTGTAFWFDPVRRGYAILLTNRTIKARVVKDFHLFRQRIFTCLCKMLN